MNALIQLKKTPVPPLLIPLVFVCFGLSPVAQAVNPAPDGGYPRGNTAEGNFALFSLTTGSANTALGFQTLANITTSSYNTAVGLCALVHDTGGSQNTANGVQALFNNTIGNFNIAIGVNALYHNVFSTANTASGRYALFNNTTGSSNLALGFQAGFSIMGSGNVCIGQGVLGLAGESNVTRIRNIGSTAQANGVFVTVGAGGKLGFQPSSRRYKDDI